MSARNFFSKEQTKQIEEAILKAEKDTSGEIRVHIENSCPGEVLTRAAEVFAKLEMHKTAQQNGVLFYLAVNDHKFAILGDAGINKTVPAHFWDDIRDHIEKHFRASRFTEGLCEGIEKAGEALKAHFPYRSDDKDELSNEVTFDNK
jgi:uncharacterized membrane protein